MSRGSIHQTAKMAQAAREALHVAQHRITCVGCLALLLLTLPACPAEDTDEARPGVAAADVSLRDLGGRSDGSNLDGGSSDTGQDGAELGDVTSDSPAVPDDATSQTPDADAAVDSSVDEDMGCVSDNRCSPSGPSSFCDGTVLIVCIPDADGCLIESARDCASEARTCEESGATAACAGNAGSGDGDTCSDAIALEPGSYTFNTSAFVDDYEDYGGACYGTGWGPDMVFAVEVPAGDLLEVSIMGDGFDMVAAIATACPDVSGSCVAYADDEITFEPEVVSITNTGASSRSYFVVADGWYSDDYGTFDITVAIR